MGWFVVATNVAGAGFSGECNSNKYDGGDRDRGIGSGM